MVWVKPKLLGSSRSDDDGNENICLDPLNLLNKGDFFFLQLNSYYNKGCMQIQKEKG